MKGDYRLLCVSPKAIRELKPFTGKHHVWKISGTDFYPTILELAGQLHKESFGYLKSVGAGFPEKDPVYSAEAKRKYLDGIVKNRLPQL
jgi:hypothetical protein